MATISDKHYRLSEQEKDHFMRYGYVCLTNCFSREKAAEWTADVWTRLGYSPTDKSTWAAERTNMPDHKQESVRTFAPKAWAAICELLGGEDRVAEWAASWNDAFIVNLGTAESEGKWPHPADLDGWHVDGDFFIHFLDSPEQALLVIPLFTDIQEHAGGTMVCPDAIKKIAKHLYDHPEGVSPYMVPRGLPDPRDREFYDDVVKSCHEFYEMTGNVGDVILLHPLMVHSASVNSLRIPRIITNPPVALKEPFNFNRDDPSQYSLVEQKTLQDLGKDRLQDWKIQGERAPVIPERLKIQEKMKEQELERLKASSSAPVSASPVPVDTKPGRKARRHDRCGLM
ncbi:hypothetical protein N7462_004321 [Penicillium macrosclerotiorum]|uniref:uncharacterized protein n=1 Tax=Penicillium macrosclerotiorum TaxID=303699 RepID=UPI0025479D00|nr:uncharacterized protein N7462_004321 [Penicillium macrosclerotiorum]KAJ5689929.1 hypothetical protein N7462_004321 [Penicillium macrosclerotiorum]